MLIHPKARSVISQLSLPTPIQKYFSNLTWDIDLSNNTNPYIGGLSEYPDIKQQSLKELYLKRLLSLNPPSSLNKSEDFGLTFENILLTVGSMEGLDLILRTFCEPQKDVICVTTPTFSAYNHWALIHGLQVKTIPLKDDSHTQIDLEEVININPKITFICDPNNPTGMKFPFNVIQKLCMSLEGFVIVDEAYIEFSDQSSSLFYLREYKNLIILRTFSKAWGLAGLRCGAILADPSIIHTLRYVQLPFSLSSLSQEKVKERLLYPEATFASWQKIKTERNTMIQELSLLKNINKVYPSDTNFILLVLKDFPFTLKKLNDHRIHVLNCSESLPHSIRVSIGTEEQNRKFLEIMRKCM